MPTGCAGAVGIFRKQVMDELQRSVSICAGYRESGRGTCDVPRSESRNIARGRDLEVLSFTALCSLLFGLLNAQEQA